MPEIVSRIVDVFVYRIVDDHPQFLVMQRAANKRLGGTWQAVHGHIDPGESAFDTARRELLEETQLVPMVWHQLERVNTFYVAGTDTIELCPGFAAQVEHDASVQLNHEHDAFDWLEFDAATARYHWPGQRDAIRDIVDIIIPGGVTADSLRLAIPD